MNYFGDKTSKALILTTEAHKLHLAFSAAAGATFNVTQPVKLDATGAIVPLGAADSAHLCIGNALHSTPNGATMSGEISVVMKGHMTIRAQSGAAIVPGPVKWASYDATNKVAVYVNATDAATTQGWALEAAGAAGSELTVVLSN